MNQDFQQRDLLVKEAFRYQDSLLSYAFGILRNWTEAQDVVQDSFLVVMDKWEEFSDGSVFFWVRKIVYFKAMETLRARQKEVTVVDDMLEALVHDCLHRYLDDTAAEKQISMRRALQKCMEQLNQISIEILTGFYTHLKPCEELASIHKRSINAIRLQLSRIRKNLQKCVNHRMSVEAG